MTPTERLAMDDAMLDCLDAHDEAILIALNANDDIVVAHEMTSALLALCHAQQVEIAELKARAVMDRDDLRRYTRIALGGV